MHCIDVKTAKLLSDLAPAIVAAVVCRPNTAISQRIAAALARRTPAVVNRAVNIGALPSTGGHHRYVATSDLAAWCGRDAYTVDEIMQALRLAARRSNHVPRRGPTAQKDPDDASRQAAA